jgi:hypothetical protein
MEYTGIFKETFGEQSGEGKNGQWQKISFVIETQGEYPKMIAFDVWKEKVAFVKTLKAGQGVTVHFDAESREYNGKYYTNLKAWKIDLGEQQAQEQQSQEPNENSDLPF